MLGIRYTALDFQEFLRRCTYLIDCKASAIVANHNLNSVRLYHQDPKFRDFCDRASLTYADGMPLILMARLLGYGINSKHRLAYNQFIYDFAKHAARHEWRIYFVGSEPGVAEVASSRLQKIVPGLAFRSRHGYFPESASASILGDIAAFRPHVLMVGLGMPRQEHWIVDHFDRLPPCLIMNVGACMDFVAGIAPVAPAWMSRFALEWLYRLVHEPRRLARRYLVESWFVFWLFAKEIVVRGLFRAKWQQR